MRQTVGIGVVVAVALGGCGGGGTTGGAQTPTTLQPGEAGGSFAQVKQRLQSAGLSPRDQPYPGDAVGSVATQGAIVIGYDGNAAAAITKAKVLQGLPSPDEALVTVVGTRVYWTVAQNHAITASERAAFQKVIRIGEGK